MLKRFLEWLLSLGVPRDVVRIEKADCFIVQAFGQGEESGKLVPGLVNEKLAEVLKELNQWGHLPILTQWEVADVPGMDELPVPLRVNQNLQDPSKYLDTYEVLRQEYEHAREHGMTRAIVIAHPLHLWRCIKTAKKLGFEVLMPTKVLQELYRANVFYPESTQWQTRNIYLWAFYELILARPVYKLKGYI